MAASSRTLPRVAHRTLFSLVALALAVGYVVTFARIAPTALQDLPNHLARAALIDDLLLHQGQAFGQTFQLHLMAVPYLLHDLLMAGAVELFGIRAGAALSVAVVLISLPCALIVYARARGLDPQDAPFLTLIGLYAATNAAFVRGFLAYCLALSFTFLTLAAMERLRARPTAARLAGYCALLMIGYLIHLTATFFTAVSLLVFSLVRIARHEWHAPLELRLYLPLAALGIWHVAHRYSTPGLFEMGAYQWDGLAVKLQHLDWEFVRFDRHADRWVLCAGLACVLAQTWVRRRISIEMLAASAAFFALYLALPSGLAMLAWLDVRALPMAAIFFVLASIPLCTDLGPSPTLSRSTALPVLPFALAVLLSTANLCALNANLRRFDAWLGDYRQVIAALPAGAWVLPVYTNTRDRPVKSTLHAAAYTLIDRSAPNPYLFSRDLGDAMQYFAYRRRPYAPDENWYVEPGGEPPDWQRIASSYRFLLVMKPYDPARIPLETASMAENSAAALLAIRPGVSTNLEHAMHQVE